MKKIIAVFLALLLTFVFASCKKAADAAAQASASASASSVIEATEAPAASTTEPETELPNPVVEVAGSEDFESALGFVITPYYSSESATYSIIDNTIAQVEFVLDGETYTYRAAKTTDDISGVYASFDPLPQSLDLQGPNISLSVLVRTIDGGASGALAEWDYDGVKYSLYTDSSTDYDEMTDVLLPIIYTDLPFIDCCG